MPMQPLTCVSFGCKATPEEPKCTVWWVCLVRLGRVFAPLMVTTIYVGAVVGLTVIVIGDHGAGQAAILCGVFLTFAMQALSYVTRAFEHEENKKAIAEVREVAATSVKQNDVLDEKLQKIATDVNGGKEQAKAEAYQKGVQDGENNRDSKF